MSDNEQLYPEDRQEYEAQFFGFTASSFVDQVYDTQNNAVDEAVLLAYRTLIEKYKNVSKDVIRKGSEELRNDIMKYLDKISDKLEVYLLNNVLNIPKNVLLPEDSIHGDHKLQYVDESALDENIEMLKMQIKTVTESIANGLKEKAQLDSLLDKYGNMLGMLDDIETCYKDTGLQQLDEDIVTFKSNATNLLDNMNSLEPMDMDEDSCNISEISNH